MNVTTNGLVATLLAALSLAPLSARAAPAVDADYSAVFDGPRWGDTTTRPAPSLSVRSADVREATISRSQDGPEYGRRLPPISLGVYAPADPEPAIRNDGIRQPLRAFAALGVRSGSR
jgi:hypothetical protein